MPAPWLDVPLERVRMDPWALARMARFILMEPRASLDTRDKDTAARAATASVMPLSAGLDMG